MNANSMQSFRFVRFINLASSVIKPWCLCLFLQDVVEPIYFYIGAVFGLQAVYVTALFVCSWVMSGTWVAGMLAVAWYVINRWEEFCHPVLHAYASSCFFLLLKSINTVESTSSCQLHHASFLLPFFSVAPLKLSENKYFKCTIIPSCFKSQVLLFSVCYVVITLLWFISSSDQIQPKWTMLSLCGTTGLCLTSLARLRLWLDSWVIKSALPLRWASDFSFK